MKYVVSVIENKQVYYYTKNNILSGSILNAYKHTLFKEANKLCEVMCKRIGKDCFVMKIIDHENKRVVMSLQYAEYCKKIYYRVIRIKQHLDS